jgi:hypothetical protein
MTTPLGGRARVYLKCTVRQLRAAYSLSDRCDSPPRGVHAAVRPVGVFWNIFADTWVSQLRTTMNRP